MTKFLETEGCFFNTRITDAQASLIQEVCVKYNGCRLTKPGLQLTAELVAQSNGDNTFIPPTN
jgi:hypothetical protein